MTAVSPSVDDAALSSCTSSTQSARKRSQAVLSPDDTTENPRKATKASRACDTCKLKKSRCTGTLPCERCLKRGATCVYEAKYSRGRPPTPPPPTQQTPMLQQKRKTPMSWLGHDTQIPDITEPNTARNSPELDAAEIEGQYFDPTSGLAFIHRAYKRLFTQQESVNPHVLGGSERTQPLTTAGDKPLRHDRRAAEAVVMPIDSRKLLIAYFETCVVTYRMFHRQSVMTWLDVVDSNTQQGLPLVHHVGAAKAAILLTIMAITTFRLSKIDGRSDLLWDEEKALSVSDQHFAMASSLTDAEAGLPTLESAQARLIQVLYLLQTSRMNKAWYMFGTAYQIIVALGLHQRPSRKRPTFPKSSMEYIHLQCQRRTFWVAYTIDAYLSVVFGRPKYFHDEDINQQIPASVNDEDMGPLRAESIDCESEHDSSMDAVIAHAQLSRIIGSVSRNVYTIQSISMQQRLSATQRAGQELKQWQSSLPPHLSSVHPSSLIPSLKRQAIALKLAYCHAIMHANRPFLLGHQGQTPAFQDSIDECISSAKTTLRIVDTMARDAMIHAFWWTPYVTFVSLAVIYVWEIQQSTIGRETSEEDRIMFALAEKCHSLLGQSTSANSPSRRYAIILEELRQEAKVQHLRSSPNGSAMTPPPMPTSMGMGTRGAAAAAHAGADPSSSGYPAAAEFDQSSGLPGAHNVHQPFQEWQTTDWLDLDASAFIPFQELDPSFYDFMPVNTV
ncbi:fungal-specific transcription factor domain-containing protein [Xylariomycetidae sp. FL2044]|nr:fungal-specific transcription factor domain-containing protein [Xylariomycetidae sp. FL2044]